MGAKDCRGRDMSPNGLKITWNDIWPHILWLLPLLIGIRFDDYIDHLPSWHRFAVKSIGWAMIFTGFAILKRRESPANEPAYVSALWITGWAAFLAALNAILPLLPWWAFFLMLPAAGVICYILGGRSIARRMQREADSTRGG